MSRLDDYTIADARSYGFGLLELYKLWHWNLCFPNTSDHDKIDEMVRAAQRELDERYQLLPVDADGEVIHIGDKMERGTNRGRVIALMLSNYPQKWGGGLHWGVQLEGEQAPTALDNLFHHYYGPTVEDVLVEFAKKMHDASFVYDRVEDTQQRIVKEYAAKLQMREDSDGEE